MSAKRRVNKDTREVEDSDLSMSLEEGKSSHNGNGALPQKSNKLYTFPGADDQDRTTGQNQSQSTEGVDNGIIETDKSALISVNGIESTVDFNKDVKPLDSQLPPSEIFSRKEMSSFLRNKKISPGTYFTHEQKRLKKQSALLYNHNGSALKKDANSNSSLSQEETINGQVIVMKSSSEPQNGATTNGSYQVPDTSRVYRPTTHLDKSNSSARYEKSTDNGATNTSNDLNKNPTSVMVTEDRTSAQSYLSSDDENMEVLDMCASATGVVRVQSRRKAEMFLVRTDGFSCTREKVTESSLAFTHPSTQQQMLLWKSTPKTVLLLKKLGQELMEEAKEVFALSYIFFLDNGYSCEKLEQPVSLLHKVFQVSLYSCR